MKIRKRRGGDLQVIRGVNDNLFQSRIFSETIANLTGSTIEVLDTTGAVGAAKAAGVAAGCYTSIREAVQTAQVIHSYRPQQHADVYRDAYELWEKDLMNQQNETVTV